MTKPIKNEVNDQTKNRWLILLIVLMIAIPLVLVVCGAIPAIWESIIKLWTAVVPSWMSLLAIVWSLGLGVLIGMFCARRSSGK